MSVSKKMIRIPHNGPIYPKGGVSGPITTPYMEDTRTIFIMITRNIKVVEVLADGSEVVLTPMNFDMDNTPTKQVPPAVDTKTTKEQQPPVKDTVPATDSVPPVNESSVDVVKPIPSNKNNNRADVITKK